MWYRKPAGGSLDHIVVSYRLRSELLLEKVTRHKKCPLVKVRKGVLWGGLWEQYPF